jgi:ATP-dependent Clp protease ATP-binding subunit ClpA
MFGAFTEEARQVVVRAHAEAHRLGHPFLGNEHLLYGLAGAGGATGQLLRGHGISTERVEAEFLRLIDQPVTALDPEALRAIGIDLDAVTERVEATFGPGALAAAAPTAVRVRHRWRPFRGRRRGHLPFTRRTISCLERSCSEARRLHHDHLGVEHLALGLLADAGGVPPRILAAIGVSPAELRAEILRTAR